MFTNTAADFQFGVTTPFQIMQTGIKVTGSQTITGVQGSTGALLLADSGNAKTTGDFGSYDANGNLQDSGVNAAASGTTIHGTPTATHLASWYNSTVLQDGGLVPHGILTAGCAGTITSNTTIVIFGLGQYGAFSCTATTTVNQVPIGAHTICNLHAYASTASATVGSGVVTLYKEGSATALTCTLSTSQSCEDLNVAHCVAFSDADRAMITTQSTAVSGDTLATITASVEVY